MSEVRAQRVGPGVRLDLPKYTVNPAVRGVDKGDVVFLTRAEADALFDALGAVLDRDVGLPRDRKMPAPPPIGGDK